MAYDKVVDSAVLDSIFTGIADAIRSKAGTTEGVAHTAMAQAVNAIPDWHGEFVWDRYVCTETTSDGFTMSATMVSTTANSFPVGALDLTFYEEYLYDKSTGTFSGKKPIKEYVQTATITSGTMLSAGEVPDGAYVFRNGRAYRTSADSKYYITTYYYNDVDYKYGTMTKVQEIKALEIGEHAGCVVSDDETTYPDGGVLDGYYYEKKAGAETGLYVWKKYELGEVVGSYISPTVASTIALPLSASAVSITFYKNVVYDETTGTFSGGEVAQTYTPSADINGAGTILTTDEIPDDVYVIISGRAYKTNSSTTYTVLKSTGTTTKYSAMLSNAYSVSYGKSDLIGCVVSDNADEYPADGVKDGFYYKQVSTDDVNYDCGTVSSSGTSITVKHKLGTTPSYVFLIKLTSPLFTSYKTVVIANSYCVYASSSSYGYSYSVSTTKNATQITFNAYSSSYPFSGVYLWVAVK